MLSRRSRVALDTLIPSQSHPSLRAGIFDAGFDAFYADFEKTALFPMRLGFRAALFTAVWVSPLLIGRVPPLTLYSRDTRERALDAVAKSRFYVIRQMMMLLKAVCMFCYGADAGVRDAVAFPLQFDDPRAKKEPAR